MTRVKAASSNPHLPTHPQMQLGYHKTEPCGFRRKGTPLRSNVNGQPKYLKALKQHKYVTSASLANSID